MKNVEFLCGSENIINTPMKPFAEDVCKFLNDVSSILLKSSQVRLYPDLTAIAFWCRKGNIQNIKNNYDDIDTRIGRGLCFHIAPSNIPINFAFSYVFSLLAGNANVVRVPSKDFPQVDFLCKVFKEILANYPEIEKRTAFVKYARTSDSTEMFSKMADCRMIWGGDDTISKIKKLESKSRCVDIAFSDRYSVAIIDAEAVIRASDDELKRLCENFYNDTYLMDQNACSSPQLICWINDNKTARERFWDFIYNLASAKYDLQDAVAVDKYTKLCENAINVATIEKVSFKTNLLYRSEFSELTPEMVNIRGKAGYFYEYSLKNYSELLNVVNEKYQTITYFGINPEELRQEILNNNIKGIDRIVPIGKAMDIDIIWDGYDLIRELSRKITIL